MPTTLILLIACLPALAAAALWMWKRPVRFLGAYLAVLPFGSAVAIPIGLPRAFSTLSSLLGVFVGALYVARWIKERRLVRRPTLSLAVWTLFLGWAAASSAWSIRPTATGNGLMVLAVLIGLFVVIVLTPITRSELQEVKGWIVGGGALTGAYALALAATGTLPKTGAGLARFEITGGGGGEGGDPNITAAALVMPIAIALWEGLDPDHPRRVRLMFLAASGLAGVAVLLTASRGGILAVGIVVVITLVSQRRGLGTLILVGLMVLPVVLLAPSTFLERADNTGTTGRADIWKLGLTSCPEYCVVGSGYDTFSYVHEDAFLTTQAAAGPKFRYQAHSIWIQTLIELGVIGLFLQVAAIFIIARDVFRVPIKARGGGFAGLMGLMFASTFLSQLTFKYFWLGLIYAVLVVTVNEVSEPTGSLTRHRLAS